MSSDYDDEAAVSVVFERLYRCFFSSGRFVARQTAALVSVEVVQKFCSNPLTLGFLKAFAKTQHCCENVDLLIEVADFKARNEHPRFDAESRKEECTRINCLYLAKNSLYEVSIDSKTRSSVEAAIARNETSPQIFEGACRHAMETIRKDTFPRFVKSSYCKELETRLMSLEKITPPRVLIPARSTVLDQRLSYDTEFSLKEYLSDARLFPFFLDYLHRSGTLSSLMCFSYIQHFKHLYRKERILEAKKLAWEMYALFISPEGARSIEIDGTLRNQVGTGMAGLGAGLFDDGEWVKMFNEVEYVVHSELKELFSRFMRSALFSQVAALMIDQQRQLTSSCLCFSWRRKAPPVNENIFAAKKSKSARIVPL